MHDWDGPLAGALFAMSALASIIGFFVASKIKAYDRHMAEAVQDQKTLAVLNTDVKNHLAEDMRRFNEAGRVLESSSKTLEWVGDCLITMSAKLDVKLPPRPE